MLEFLRSPVTFCSRIRLVRRQCGWWRWRRGRSVHSFSELLATTKWVSIILCFPLLSACPKLLIVISVDFCLRRVEDEDSSSRKTRLLRLCSYLQHKYKHMCRQERASIRQKKYRYAFRKALLHAASNNPDSAGQLIQELRGVSRRWSRYLHQFPIATIMKC